MDALCDQNLNQFGVGTRRPVSAEAGPKNPSVSAPKREVKPPYPPTQHSTYQFSLGNRRTRGLPPGILLSWPAELANKTRAEAALGYPAMKITSSTNGSIRGQPPIRELRTSSILEELANRRGNPAPYLFRPAAVVL